MKATVGDRIVVRGHQVGGHDRHGTIVEVHGADGAPPYMVRSSDGHEGLFFPGSDGGVEHVATSGKAEPEVCTTARSTPTSQATRRTAGEAMGSGAL